MASSLPSAADPLTQAQLRVQQLEAALRASEEAEKLAKQELQFFVYAASHDLQEPLRAISNYAQLVERRFSRDPETKELTAFIIEGVTRMNGLIQNLLAYSRMNPAPLFSNVRLDAVLQSVKFKLAASIKETGAVIQCAALPEITAFETQICQLFEQIILNALTFRGPSPPLIEITAGEGEVDGDAAQIVSITDNGCGMEPQYFKTVLAPFKRLHGKNFPGNGLGLAICEKIMRAHHGKLWIESAGPGHGTTVRLAFLI